MLSSAVLAVVVVILLIATAAAANCIFRGRTCPPPGTLREMLEDALAVGVGFFGGRASK